MAVRVEKEIQKLLRENSDIKLAAEKLISWANSQYVLNKQDIEAVSNFLIKNDFHQSFAKWMEKNIANSKFEIPWAQLLESVALSKVEASTDFVTDLREGMREQQAFLEAAKSRAFDTLWEDLGKWRERIPAKVQQDLASKKDQMLFQISTFRTAHLPAQEKQLLLRLLKLFPSDQQVQSSFQDHRERYAMDIVSRAQNKKHINYQALENDTDTNTKDGLTLSVLENAKSHPELALDLCIASVAMNEIQLALDCLSFAEPSKAKDWIFPELLLQLGRHLELIEYLKYLESTYSNDPDCFFATAYFRAQALYGIGNKNMAIEVLESLMDLNPDYRSSSALLRDWRQS